MNKQKAREWALELSGRQGPTSLGIQHEVFAMAGSQAERHQLLGLMQEARSDDAALGQLAQWILKAKPVALSDPGTDDRIWEGSLEHACNLAGRGPMRIGLETLDNYDEPTAKKLKRLAEAARSDEQALKELARAFYVLTTGQSEAPSLKKIKDVPAWLSSLKNARKLAKISQKGVANWLKEQYPKLSQAKFLGLLELAGHAAESPKAQQLLAVELYRIFETETPVKIPSGFHDTTPVKFSETARQLTEGMRRARGLSERTTNSVIALSRWVP